MAEPPSPSPLQWPARAEPAEPVGRELRWEQTRSLNKIKRKYTTLKHRGGMRQNSKRGQWLKCLENFRDAVVKWKTTALAGIAKGSRLQSKECCEEAAVKIPVSQPGRGIWEHTAARSDCTPAESRCPAAPHSLSCKPETMKDIPNFFQATRNSHNAFAPLPLLQAGRASASSLTPTSKVPLHHARQDGNTMFYSQLPILPPAPLLGSAGKSMIV